MEPDHRRGSKTRLRLSTKRRKRNNLAQYIRDRRAGLPTLNKDILGNQQEKSASQEPCSSTSASTQNDIAEVQISVEDETSNNMQVEQEKESSKTTEIKLNGARVVQIQEFIDALKLLSSHSKIFGCGLANMDIIKEEKVGFESKITFKCNMCHFTRIISTCPEHPERIDINTAAVSAIMNAGSGYTQMKKISEGMSIPCFSFTLYKKVHSEVCNAWEDIAWKCMKEAAEEEAKMAIECGNVDANGTPMITVVCDGSWAKRSYRGGGNYNSLSGVAAIVGAKTQKILFLGVKNKYCCVCQRAKNINETAAEHTCYKNWTSSSTAMEAAIIAEGFCSSVNMYNLIYSKMIADGDSSCYKKILDSRPYQNCSVQKIECINHLLRNYCNKLREVSKVRGVPGSIKNVISKNILRCRVAITKAVKYRQTQKSSEEEKIKSLKKDVLNSVSHIFGEHKNCSQIQYFCQKTQPDVNNYLADFRTFNLEEKIMDAVRFLANHARSLLENVHTNTVEQFNAQIALKVGGKRVNYTQRRCYQARCFSAVVSRNTKKPLSSLHKHLTGYSPERIVQRLERSKTRKAAKKKLKFSHKEGTDSNYGERCNKPDIDEHSFEEIKLEFLESLQKTEDELMALEMRTRLQSDSTEWKLYRKKILTASLFGQICKMKSSTSCASTVKTILYKEFESRATNWGKSNENRAKEQLQSKFGLSIKDCGLFINKSWPYLGASPDGIEEISQHLIEIKCPYKSRFLTIREAIANKCLPYLEIVEDQYKLKKNHNYYFQIQGQLNIACKDICYFSVWTLKEVILIKVPVDKSFFMEKMLPKLEKFFFNCLLPEIIDPRHTRGMQIRDPSYITDHIQKI